MRNIEVRIKRAVESINPVNVQQTLQEGQLSVTGESMCTKSLVSNLGELTALNSVDWADKTKTNKVLQTL